VRAPIFVLDVHLDKLARHLRMVGFDALWSSEHKNPELLKISNEEFRILLTKDRALHDLASADRKYYVEADEPGEQLREVLERFELKDQVLEHKGFLSRCLECNSPIVEVNGKQIEDRIPKHVLREHQEFYFCPRCERVYWKSSHFERMKTWIQRLLSGTPALVLIFSIGIFGGLLGGTKSAFAAKVKPADLTKPPYSTFVDACETAFNQSTEMPAQTDEHGAFGKTVCACTAGESKLQGVTTKELDTETQKIKADAKYKIANPKLLASLQYCTLKTMDALPPDSDKN
jgi:uncharacterized protein with PIN domain